MLTNLKVVMRMGSSVVGDPTLPLDGILLYYAALEAYGEPPQAQRPNEPLRYDPAILPIEIVTVDYDVWFYKCSFAQYEVAYRDGKDFINKRMDVALLDLARYKAQPNLQSGYYKARHDEYAYRITPAITWYLQTSDPDRVVALLSRVTGVGKETNVGHGLVLGVDVIEVSEDYSVARDGVATRALPVAYAAKHGIRGRRSIRTIRPPYWATSSYTEVVF